MKNDPYQIIKRRHVTEKATMLENLKDSDKNPSIRRFKSPKYVFIVDKKANKNEIAGALEEIYSNQGIKVVSVNTITIKPKSRKIRGRFGYRPGHKKAIVTLEVDDSLGNI